MRGWKTVFGRGGVAELPLPTLPPSHPPVAGGRWQAAGGGRRARGIVGWPRKRGLDRAPRGVGYILGLDLPFSILDLVTRGFAPASFLYVALVASCVAG